jgi:hypothetical protein
MTQQCTRIPKNANAATHQPKQHIMRQDTHPHDLMTLKPEELSPAAHLQASS